MKRTHKWGLALVALLLGLLPVVLFSAAQTLGAPPPQPLAQTSASLSKTASVITATLNEIFTYTVTYTIPAGVTLNGAQLVDCIPNNSPSSEPNFTYQTATGPTPGTGDTPAVPPVTPENQGSNCWAWNLGNIANTSGADYVYIITYQVAVNPSGSVRGEVGINEATLSWNEGADSVNTSASVTVVTPNISNSARVDGPDGQVALQPGGSNLIEALRAGDIITLTLNFENVADLNVSTAYSVVIYSLIPDWIVNLQPVGSTPTPDISISGSNHVVRWHAPGRFTGPGETELLATLQPGEALTFTLRGEVIANIAPGQQQTLNGYGSGGSTSNYNTLPGLTGRSVNFTGRNITLRSARIAMNKTAIDLPPIGFLATNDVVTYTIVYTIPHGTTVPLPARFEDQLYDGLHFGGVISQPAGVTTPTITPVGNNYTAIRWEFEQPVTATTDITYTYIFTAVMDSHYFIGSNAGTQIPRRTAIHNDGRFYLDNTNLRLASGLLNARATIYYARPYFDDIQKCLWRDGSCRTGTQFVEGDELLTFYIRYTRNGGRVYSGDNILATEDAYNVVVSDWLPADFTLVDAWPTNYVTATVGNQTVITWTTWPSVTKGYYIPGVNPPTPSITETFFIVTATVPITVPGGAPMINNVAIAYEDITGAQFNNSTSLQMQVPVYTSKDAATAGGIQLRVGDLISYTIIDEITRGAYLFWPEHEDRLPRGVYYVPGSFTIEGGTLITTTEPVTRTDTTYEYMDWWLASQGESLITQTFQARLTGVQPNGIEYAKSFANLGSVIALRNDQWLRWNFTDTSSGYDMQLSSNASVQMIQPRLASPWDDVNFGKHVAATSSGSLLVEPGDLITYVINLRNTGYAPAYDVILSDTLPADLTFVTYTAALSDSDGMTYTPIFDLAPVAGDQVLRWQLQEIPPKTTASGYGLLTLWYTVRVSYGAENGTVLTNTVSLIDYSSLPGDSPYERHYGDLYTGLFIHSEPVTVTSPFITLGLDKFGPAEVLPGQTFTYTLVYSKTGGGAPRGYLTDTLPVDLTHVGYRSTAPVTLTSGAPTLVWELGPLTDGAQGQIVITVTTPLTLDIGATFVNHAAFNVEDGEPVTDTVTSVYRAIALTLTKEAPAMALPGSDIVYTIHYGNTGNVTATDVFLGELYDPQVTFVAASPPPDFGDNAWSLGDLSGGASGTILITVTINATDGYTVHNEVTLSASNADPITATADTLVTTHLVTLEKHAPAIALPNSDIVYTIHYGNQSDLLAANLVITEVYDAQTSFVAADPSPDLGTDNIWTLGDLSGGASGTILITVTTVNASEGYTVHNEALLSISGAAPITATADTLVVSNLLILDKVGPVFAQPGDLFTYTLTYTSTGLSDSTGVVLRESYPPEVTFVSADPPPTAGNNTWQLGTVAPDTSDEIRITVRVNSPLADGTLITNTAIINAANAIGAEASWTTRIHSGPLLQISKRAAPLIAYPGDTLVYTIDYANIGNDQATGVVITETYDALSLFVAADPPPDAGTDNVWTLGALPIGSGRLVITTTISSMAIDGATLYNLVTLDCTETPPVTATHTLRLASRAAYLAYLPLVTRGWEPPLADLAVTAITIAPANPTVGEETVISITIVNQGSVAVSDFWVDLYINPTRPPQPGEIWNDIAPVGKAWLIHETLAPGASLVINTTQPDDPLNPGNRYSNWPGYFTTTGSHTLYAQADSYPAPFGVILEKDEYNNIHGPILVTVAGNGALHTVPLPDVNIAPRP